MVEKSDIKSAEIKGLTPLLALRETSAVDEGFGEEDMGNIDPYAKPCHL